MKIGDKVRVHTDLIKCRLLGRIDRIVGDTYYVALTFPIRGVKEVQCELYQMQRIEPKKNKPVHNKKLKSASSGIIQRLKAIADNTEQRQEQTIQQQQQQHKRDIKHSNNWLDYMADNDID